MDYLPGLFGRCRFFAAGPRVETDAFLVLTLARRSLQGRGGFQTGQISAQRGNLDTIEGEGDV